MRESRMADLVYGKLISANGRTAAKTAFKIINAIQQEKVENQLLGIAAVFIAMLDNYEVESTDLLRIAHNMLYYGGNSDMAKTFRAIQDFMKTEWEI